MDGGYPQDVTITLIEHCDVVVADDRYRIGTQVKIIQNDEYDRGRNTLRHSGTIVMCHRERNDHSHLVAVYVLLDEYKAYDPLIVAKGTPRNVCLCGDNEQ